MKHQRVEQLRTVAAVHSKTMPPMSSLQRLERWAELLELKPARRLNTLRETELFSPRLREAMRAEVSPISIAFADPILSAEGLRDDTYGEAKRFFDLSDRQMHDILCYCRFGGVTSARASARAIRRVIAAERHPGWFATFRQWLSGPSRAVS
jgi:hypothetical protein